MMEVVGEEIYTNYIYIDKYIDIYIWEIDNIGQNSREEERRKGGVTGDDRRGEARICF